MRATIIICTYNRAALLGKVLRDLAGLIVPEQVECELLVVDNNSSDDTPRIVAEASAAGRPRTAYVFEAQQGLSHARNAGVRAARGDVLLFTDDDVRVDPRWLVEMLRPFDDPSCMGVAGRVVADWTFSPPSWLATRGPYSFPGPLVEFDLGEQARRLHQIPPIGASMAYRREVFERHGLFMTQLGASGTTKLLGEDTEFGSRLLSDDEVVVYAPDAVVYHPVEASRITKPYLQRWHYIHGRTENLIKGIPTGTVQWFGVPRYLIGDSVRHLFGSVFSRDIAKRFYHKLQLYRAAGVVRSRWAGEQPVWGGPHDSDTLGTRSGYPAPETIPKTVGRSDHQRHR